MPGVPEPAWPAGWELRHCARAAWCTLLSILSPVLVAMETGWEQRRRGTGRSQLLRVVPVALNAPGSTPAFPAPSYLWASLPRPLPVQYLAGEGQGSPRSPCLRRRARFKRSNSVTAGVQADLELEGFTGLAVATEDKALQFGRPFQRHSSEPESGRQYAVYKTVHTQGQWAYREDYQLQYDTVEVPRRDAWIERGSRSLPDSGRASPCHRDGEWFIKLLQAEVEKMEGWCQQMEREAEDYDLPEESESGGGGRSKERGWGSCRAGGHSHCLAELPP